MLANADFPVGGSRSTLTCDLDFETGSTVLVMCADEAQAADLLRQLYDAGVNAVGPVTTAKMALMLTAQAAPTDAILAGPTTGETDVLELAEVLTGTWGVRCVLIPTRASPAL